MNDDLRRTPEEIEDHIALTRGRIDATLSAIEHRLTTEQLLHQGVDYLRHSGAAEFAMNLGGSVKHHPLPVSLVAIGLGWLMMLDRSDRRVGHETRQVDDPNAEHAGFAAKVESLKSKAVSARHRVSEATQRIGDATHAARDRASQIGEGARAQWGKARDGYENVVREQPLALGVIGFSIGALCAAILPRTQREDALMGEASDRVSERAQAMASERLEDAQRVAAAAAEAAGEEARSVGSRATAERSEAAQMRGSAPGRLKGSPPGSAYRMDESAQPALRSLGVEHTREPEVSSPAEAPHASGLAARSRSDR